MDSPHDGECWCGGKDGIGRYTYEWDDAEGRRIEMVNSCIVNKAREMFILTFLHAKGDDLTVAPPPPLRRASHPCHLPPRFICRRRFGIIPADSFRMAYAW